MFILAFTKAFPQLTTSNSLSPAQMVQNILVGNGITASNVSYTGYVNGIATFTAGTSINLGLSSGIFLTTGSFLANDPNGFLNIGTDGPFGPSSKEQNIFQFKPGDPDLNAILVQTGANLNTYDAAILEFDFIPDGDTVSFRYRFGSDEYNSKVSPPGGFTVEDVFAAFISGVSVPLTKRNIALIPGTTSPLTINTVNNGYSVTSSNGPCTNCAYYTDNYSNAVNVIYNGLTTILTAKYPVICGQTYHIKFAIGDAMDRLLDSGVFIEANSFKTSSNAIPLNITVAVNGNTSDSTIAEGCDSASITLNRPLSASASSQTYTYTISGTATNGTDYPLLSGSVIIPAGSTTASFPIIPINDGITEGVEKITLAFQASGPCGGSGTLNVNLYIHDLLPVQLNMPDTIVCGGQAVTLTAQPTGGGGGPYTYLWNTGATSASIVVNPAIPTTYWCTVSTGCGNNTYTDTINVAVYANSQLNVSSDVLFSTNDLVFREGCDSLYIIFNRGTTNLNSTETFLLSVSGTANNGVDYNSIPSVITFNSGQAILRLGIKAINDGISEGTETLVLSIPGNICNPANQSISITIQETPPLTLSPSPAVSLNCPGNNALLTVTASGGTSSYNYSWNPGTSTTASQTVNPLTTTSYTVTVTDSACLFLTAQAIIAVTVPVAQPLTTLVSSNNIQCPGEMANIQLQLSGGFPPYSYLWNNGSTAAAISVSPAQSTTYTVAISDACNFYKDTLTVPVTVKQYVPLTLVVTNDTIICPKNKLTLSALAANGVKPYTYTWENTFSGQNYMVAPAGLTTYAVQVKDSCGNTISDAVVVNIAQVKADFTFEYLDDNAVSFVNQSLSNQSLQYTWNFGDSSPTETTTNPIHTFSSLELYYTQLTAITPEGCKDMVSYPLPPPYELWIPDAFTPGEGDKLNAEFMAYGVGVAKFNMSIFNRWGNKIYETQNIQQGWDGTYNGKPCPEDVYVYIIDATGVDTKKKTNKTGRITLIR